MDTRLARLGRQRSGWSWLDPAVTVRPELAAYSFDEDGAEATIAVVARTAPGVPPPSGTFAMHVFSDRTSGTATVGDDYEVLGINVVFGTADFTAAGDVWEARKEVSLTIVDDDVAEAAETVDVAVSARSVLLRRSGSGRAMPTAAPAWTMSAPCRSRSPPTMAPAVEPGS